MSESESKSSSFEVVLSMKLPALSPKTVSAKGSCLATGILVLHSINNNNNNNNNYNSHTGAEVSHSS